VSASLLHPDARCPGSVYGFHDPDRRGVCAWCARQICRPVARPVRPRDGVSQASSAYRYYFDPDFGSDRDDVY
jgi:hypothetical protein